MGKKADSSYRLRRTSLWNDLPQKRGGGGNKRKIPFSPAQKSTVPKSHTHKKGQNIYGSFLREDCGEDIYI